MDCRITGDIASLVTPPHGLKHRLLAETSRQDRNRGMHASIEEMIAGGVTGCADFREGGLPEYLPQGGSRRVVPLRTVIFGRDGGEEIADGFRDQQHP